MVPHIDRNPISLGAKVKAQTNFHLRIDNSPFGLCWCGCSIMRTDMSSLQAYKHSIYYLEAGLQTFLIV